MTTQLPNSITHYLDRCTEVELERLMTTRLVPHYTHTMDSRQPAGCLVGVARGAAVRENGKFAGDRFEFLDYGDWGTPFGDVVGDFNWLADEDRDGTEQAIRDYIVQLRINRGGTIHEPAMVGELVSS